ncbi:alpha-tocopherol transfer protein-like [Planococcus citri]|uniref:alpha-tocopherol transfer protein-like n=1 Tax=Planococcus citri TaxID=170843 RepID=UPI0031F9D659
MKFEHQTCEEEYARDPKLDKEDIQQLMQWIEKQPHMPRVSEYHVMQYYHCSDYSQQKAKDLLDLHYAYRNEALELFHGPGYEAPKYPHNIWDIVYIIELPKPSPEGYRLIYCGLKDTTPSKYNFDLSLHTFIKAMMTVVMEQGHCPGYAFIFDIHGIVISHLATVSISSVRKFLYFVQEAVPVKVKAVHVVNISPIIDRLMMLAKPFLKKELYEMIHIQSDMNVFYQSVPKDLVPSDIGGTLPSRIELQAIFKAKLDAMESCVDEELRLRTDEKKRANKPNAKLMHNSMQGSFKKLAID